MAKLKHSGGQGYAHLKENGKYEVKATETRRYDKLSDAKNYYYSLNEEKAIWDVKGVPELIDSHVF